MKSGKGFGTFSGVFVPNVTMMFGVILFLRLGVIVGNVGMGAFTAYIAISLTLMLITSFSIAAIVTNMRVGSGGVYYLVSRSLGIEWGGAIGIALVASQVISLSLCTSGFAYSFVELFPNFNVTQVELLTLVLLAMLSIFSTELALRLQTVIFVVLFASIISVLFSNLGPTETSSLPIFERPLSFWQGFVLFYPALTGIEAGMALSGNLKNPRKSLIWGNIGSLILVALTYLGIAYYVWKSFDSSTLRSDPLILVKQAKFPLLIYVGIWCATLSSALGNLLGAPRMLQMISEDGVMPEIFSRAYGKQQEPRYAIIAVFAVALVLTVLTTIDQILPILTMICLLTYGTLNLSAGLCELIHSTNWRPTIRIPWQLSLAAALLALFLMLMFEPLWTIISACLVGGIYLFLKNKSLDAGFQDFRKNITFFFSRKALYKLSEGQTYTFHWIPQMLLLSRSPTQREKMIRLADSMTHRSGILSIISIVPEVWEDPEQLQRTGQTVREWLQSLSIECFNEVQSYPDFVQGAVSAVKSYGLGSLQPNTIMLTVDRENSESLLDLAEVADTARLYGKNFTLFFDSKKIPDDLFTEKISKRKAIDLWWSQEGRENFDLIVKLILCLRASLIWSPRNMTFKALAQDENAKSHMLDHFSSLFKELRIKANIEIYTEEEIAMDEAIAKYSKQADLVFFPLYSISEFDAKEAFAQYLSSLAERLPEGVACLGVTNNQGG